MKLEPYSVLMSMYHRDAPAPLRQSIESMLAQTVPCDQFVLVRDGPIGDELAAVVDSFVQSRPGLFTVVELPENVSLGLALDAGLQHCRNDLVARMDADDISLPERCEKLLKLFADNPELAIAGANIDEFYGDPSHVVFSRVVPSDHAGIRKFMRRRSPFNHPTVMYRKSAVLRCGGYGSSPRKEDLSLFARMLNNGCLALNLPESLLLYRSSPDNYKRRKTWVNCWGYIQVEWDHFRRGYCSLWDFAVVAAGQTALFLAPLPVMRFLSDRFLRHKSPGRKSHA